MKKAAELRVREHRLKPGLRIRTREEIIKFIHDKGLVSVLGGNELPSVISAILGKAWKPSGKGFSGWLDWWSVKVSGQQVSHVLREVEGGEDVLAGRLFRRTKTFVSDKLWPVLDPIVKHHEKLAEKENMLSELEERVLNMISSEGAIRTDRLRRKLSLEAREDTSKFHRALSNLESYMLIVGVEDPKPERHLHANIWQTWEKRIGKRIGNDRLTLPDAVGRLFEKTIDACVLTPEDQVGNWFRWCADPSAIIKELLRNETVRRIDAYLVSSRVLTG